MADADITSVENWPTKHQEAKKLLDVAKEVEWQGNWSDADIMRERANKLLEEEDEAVPPF